MADDFDDDKGQKDTAYLAQFDNVVNDIKSQIRTTNPAELARLNASITTLLSSDLPSKILSKLQNLQAVVREREEQAEQVVRYTQEEQNKEAEEARLLQERIELLEKEAQKAANEVREKELEEHVKKYKDFQKDFNDQLKADSDLLDQAIKDPNSLTAEQRVQLTGQYATDKEREAAKKRQQKMSKCWKEHYAIKNKAKESIAYRQGGIKENDAVINHPDTPEPVREQRRQENVVHKQEVVKQEQNLAVIKPEEQGREKERGQILALVNGGSPELARQDLKEHYLNHKREYDEERQQDPNHQGYNELHSMIMALGGHEKLGLPKPEHPIAEQQTPSAQNIKSASAIEPQVKAAEKPATQIPQEQAAAYRKSLEQLVVRKSNVKGESQKSLSEVASVAANNDPVHNNNQTAKPKSRFAQNLKKMEGRG